MTWCVLTLQVEEMAMVYRFQNFDTTKILCGSLVTTTWCSLSLWMQEMASIHGGYLALYCY